ncbi:hypothetical protein EGQ50_00540 [Coxiella endosymbiont of Amblyomma sculptum]|nr:hypothetical protein EGQ50_00540 [Coxiella endosymbiont of Amblyomma sculptum]
MRRYKIRKIIRIFTSSLYCVVHLRNNSFFRYARTVHSRFTLYFFIWIYHVILTDCQFSDTFHNLFAGKFFIGRMVCLQIVLVVSPLEIHTKTHYLVYDQRKKSIYCRILGADVEKIFKKEDRNVCI